jgi:hypothetical protein
MEPLSRSALVMLVQALDVYRGKTLEDLKSDRFTNDQKYALEQYMSQIEAVFDEIKDHYNECRTRHPDMMPFSELISSDGE